MESPNCIVGKNAYTATLNHFWQNEPKILLSEQRCGATGVVSTQAYTIFKKIRAGVQQRRRINGGILARSLDTV